MHRVIDRFAVPGAIFISFSDQLVESLGIGLRQSNSVLSHRGTGLLNDC